MDFGLIDKDGKRLLENPVHYRDSRTEGMLEESFKMIDKQKFYEITGQSVYGDQYGVPAPVSPEEQERHS